MYKKIVVAAVTTAAIVGGGSAALAVTTPGTATAANTAHPATPANGKHQRHPIAQALRRAVHAQLVTRDKFGTFVTHDAIRGTTTAVSPTSITVRAADKTSQTYRIDAHTHVRVRANGSSEPASVASLHDGDRVIVLGVGARTYLARHIIELGGS